MGYPGVTEPESVGGVKSAEVEETGAGVSTNQQPRGYRHRGNRSREVLARLTCRFCLLIQRRLLHTGI